jgi:DNA-binding transcriptional ArsR family regulator
MTDPALVTLFGSKTRVRTLAVLASAARPMTAYRIAKVGEVAIPKVYAELPKLSRAGIVGHRDDGWVLLDDDVRSLLRKRVRIAWAQDFIAESERMGPARKATLARLAKLPPPKFDTKGWTPKHPKRLMRHRGKDRILRQMGLRRSNHA